MDRVTPSWGGARDNKHVVPQPPRVPFLCPAPVEGSCQDCGFQCCWLPPSCGELGPPKTQRRNTFFGERTASCCRAPILAGPGSGFFLPGLCLGISVTVSAVAQAVGGLGALRGCPGSPFAYSPGEDVWPGEGRARPLRAILLAAISPDLAVPEAARDPGCLRSALLHVWGGRSLPSGVSARALGPSPPRGSGCRCYFGSGSGVFLGTSQALTAPCSLPAGAGLNPPFRSRHLHVRVLCGSHGSCPESMICLRNPPGGPGLVKG